MPDLESLLDQVDEMRDEIVALEQDLVRIPTVNTGFMPTGNETEVCEYLKKWPAEDGIDSEIIESAPGRGNFIARPAGSSGKAGRVCMAPHAVRPAEEWGAASGTWVRDRCGALPGVRSCFPRLRAISGVVTMAAAAPSLTPQQS